MVASSAREQSKDNPCWALQTVTTKKLATALVDVLMLKQLILASSPEEFSASFPFLGPTSSVVPMSGTDALGTAWSLSLLPLEFAKFLTLSVFILGVISSHFEALWYSLTPLICCDDPLLSMSITVLCLHKSNLCAAASPSSHLFRPASTKHPEDLQEWELQVRISVVCSESEPCDTLLNRTAGTHKQEESSEGRYLQLKSGCLTLNSKA